MKQILKSALLPPLILILLSTATMVYFDRPLIRGDGVAYLAWLDTFVRDQDLDLTNQYQRFQTVNTYQITWDTDTQRFVNIFPFGVAFLQAPFYVLGGWITDQGLINQNPDYFVQMQGVEQAYSLSIMVGANLMALITILLAWRIARYFTGNWTAVFLAWAFFIGTPLFYYSTVSPLNSHNPGAFLLTCMVYLVIVHTRAFRGKNGPSRDTITPPLYFWILLGVLAGLIVLVRWQQALTVAIIWGLLVWQRQWKGLIIATIAAAVVMLPLPLVWNHLFLKPFVVPYNENTGESFMGLPVNAHRVFLRMLRYSPILVLSLLGIPFLARIDRKWAVVSVAMIGIQILVNGSTRDWYDGDSWGTRRMAELYPIYVLLAAALLGYLPSLEEFRRREALRPVGFRVILAGLAVYSILFIMAFFLFTWTNPLGVFSDSPEHMISYYFDHPNRQETLEAVLRAHVGPSSWSMPGP